MAAQAEFNFDSQVGAEGYINWVANRKIAAAELAKRICLPLGHQVEVWLTGNIRLRGLLKLKEELLFVEEERIRHMELVVDKVAFAVRDMESCVRLD